MNEHVRTVHEKGGKRKRETSAGGVEKEEDGVEDGGYVAGSYGDEHGRVGKMVRTDGGYEDAAWSEY